jgi:peptide/nickel transport system substrate-binding protein
MPYKKFLSKEALTKVQAAIILIIIAIAVVAGVAFYSASLPSPTPPPTDVTTYVFGFNSDPSSLDPAVVFDDSTIQMGRIYETLVRVSPDMKIEPCLATSWNVSSDGLTWIFNLRRNVKFHDGTPFNATAVKFSFERTLEINKGGAYILYCIDKMEVLDPYTIKFTLKYPVPFDYIMGSQYSAYIVSPSYVMANEQDGDLGQAWLAEHTCGTGPYKLKDWVHGQYVILEKFDDYWGGWAGKHVDKVIIEVIREVSTAAIELEEGKIDTTWILPYETVEALRGNPKFVISESPSLHTFYWRINTIKPPTDNVKVRQALCYAFPYGDAINTAFLGHYAERLQGPLPKAMWGHDDELFMYDYNLTKARELFTEAGYPNGGFTIDLYYYSGSEPQRKMAELFKSSLAELGITLDARAFPFDQLYPICVNPETAPHLSAHDWWPTYTDPYDFLYGCFASDSIGGFNWSFWNSTEFDELIEQANALSVVDRPKAIELYKQAQLLTVEEATTIFLAQLEGISVSRSWVYGWTYNPNYLYVPDYYSIYKELP